MSETPHCTPHLDEVTLSDACNASSANLFLTMLNTLVTYSSIIGAPCKRITPVRGIKVSYDYIVVGSGAGGSVVAARLSEIANRNVLLLEAGPDEPAGAQVPSNMNLYLNTKLDWKYKTSNESFACLRYNGSCKWPRGKNLGGCTVHHGMAYHRGHAKDYDRWEEMGNVGWSWQDVLPYFLKSENNEEIERVGTKYHAVGGPMTVERFPWQPQFARDILEAARDVGFGVSEDLMGANITGFTIAQTMSKNGVRISSSRAFLWHNRNRKNLHIALNATATKINTKKVKSEREASGVTFRMNGREYVVKANREVILAAGTINSPQLLLLSGIGPASHLRSVGIRPVHDLPGVGENLHNHVSYGLDFVLKDTKINELNVTNVAKYIYNQTGPMSSTGLAQVTGILTSNYTTLDDPDIQIFFAGYQAVCNTSNGMMALKTYGNKEVVRFISVNLRPLSRGRITLASKNPFKHPIIWSNDLAHPQDRSIVYQGVEKIMKLIKSKAMQKHDMNLLLETIPECTQFQSSDSDLNYNFLDCQFRHNTRPENHQAGTCKMGPSWDHMAVVDPNLKVYGIKNLRVADASIMPKMVSGNPTAVISMIGERVADFIKAG